VNPTWISLIVGATSLIIAAIAFRFSYRFAWKRKRLVCEILPIVPLVSVREQAKGLVKVLFNDEPVSDVKTLIINVRNSGNEPIEASDFAGPLKIILGEGARILIAEVTGTEPMGIPTDISTEDSNKVVLAPTLLNEGDAISLGITSSGPINEQSVNVEARIRGVKSIPTTRGIEPATVPYLFPLMGGLVVFLILAVALWTTLTSYIDPQTTSERTDVLQSFAIIMLGVAGTAGINIVLVWLRGSTRRSLSRGRGDEARRNSS
jgi:hypothetical protein